MTTFTRIPEGDTPSIDVDVSKRLSKIGELRNSFLSMNECIIYTNILADDNIYGGFME